MTLLLGASARTQATTGAEDRAYTVRMLDKIARPVMAASAEGKLKEKLPLRPDEKGRADCSPLEAFGRTLDGIAPWLALGPDSTEEGKLRAEYMELARKGLVQCTAEGSPGRLNFSKGGQPLVDAAFLAQALLRAPKVLWEPLTAKEKKDVMVALKETRKIKPPETNWLLFSALVEAAIFKFEGDGEMAPLKRAIDKHEQWYLGDGTYGDGPSYHWDYYNSYVIQPALLSVMEVCQEKSLPQASLQPKILGRAVRYAGVQERLISPEGTFPVIGRSSAYRFGALQHLSLMALKKNLPADVKPAAVRCALTTVIKRMSDAPGTFTEGGWLNAGAVGEQPEIREHYISTGSLYLCLTGMLHLGLPADDPFWTAPAEKWTQARIWAGQPAAADHAYEDPKK